MKDKHEIIKLIESQEGTKENIEKRIKEKTELVKKIK
jgi:hypothetical protein